MVPGEPRAGGGKPRPRAGRPSAGQPSGGQPTGGSLAAGPDRPTRRPRPDVRPRPAPRAGEQRVRDLRQTQPPAGTDPRALDSDVRGALRPLGPAVADRVAAHLVAAGELLDRDPVAALEQARAARAFAARIGLVREAVGLAAYAASAWHEALAELRAERRLTGSVTHLPVMADCERGLGRPQRALDLAQSAEVQQLDEAGRIEMLIVASGARRDLDQRAAAVASLQTALGDRAAPQPWSARLWYAYADALLAVGRQAEAVEWFAAVAAIDDGETDAEERLLELDPMTPLD